MASNTKNFKSKPAGAQKVDPGPSGKMKKFGGSPAQKPGVTETSQMSGKGPEFPKGGPSGKMNRGTSTTNQKSGVTGTTLGGSSRSSYAK